MFGLRGSWLRSPARPAIGVVAGLYFFALGPVAAAASPSAESLSSPPSTAATVAATSQVVSGSAVLGWGSDYLGAVGTGETITDHTSVPFPTPVAGTSALAGRHVTEVSSSYMQTCAIADGDPVCWGTNIASVPAAADPNGVMPRGSLTDISVSDGLVCAVSRGKAYCWGSNFYGELGNNSTVGASSVPVPVWDDGVLAGRGVQQVVTSTAHVCALADGQVFCWGRNLEGMLGDGSTSDSRTPVAVDRTGALRGLVIDQIAAGGNNTCARAETRVYCWGDWTALGRTSSEQFTAIPTEIDTSGVLAGRNITDLKAGSSTVCVIADQKPFCWGANGNNGLGAGLNVASSSVPVAVDTSGALAGKDVTQLVVGWGTSCVLASGEPVCWGGNLDGEFGAGYLGGKEPPVATYVDGALAGRTITHLGGGGLSFFAVTAEPAGLATAPGTFTPVGPGRILDTRTGVGAPRGSVAASGRIDLQVAGVDGVPADASAVSINVTVTGSSAAGYLTAFPAGSAAPLASNLNFGAAETVANMVVTGLGRGGRVSVFNGSSGPAQVIADVTGYYLGGTPVTPGAFRAVTPTRLLDTRTGTGSARGPVTPAGSVRVMVDGQAGIPPLLASAVVVNLTATNSTSSGYISGFASGSPRPATSNLNFTPGRTVASLAVIPVADDGSVTLFNGSTGPVDLVADVVGYYFGGHVSAAGGYVPVDPVRLIDTRISLRWVGRLEPFTSAWFTVAGRAGLPPWSTASALVTATVVAPTAPGYASVRPASAVGLPQSSTLNFGVGQTVANSAVTPSAGKVTNGSPGTADVIVDVFGYFHS